MPVSAAERTKKQYLKEKEEQIYSSLIGYLEQEISAGDCKVTFSEDEGVRITPSQKDGGSFKTLEERLRRRGFNFVVKQDHILIIG